MSASTPGDAEALRADYPLLSAILPVSSATLLSRSTRARVYRVTDSSEASYVVKLTSPAAVEAAVALTEALGACRGVARIVRSGAAAGSGYLVYDAYAENLAQLLTRERLGPLEVAHLLAPVAEAIERLHTLGYVHGDVKPANVLVSATGTGLLADLDESMPVGAFAARFTPGFAAPELGGDAVATAASTADIYGFASTVAVSLRGPRGAQLDDAAWSALLASLGDAATALAADLDGDARRRTVPPTHVVRLLALAAGAGSLPGSWPPPPGAVADPIAPVDLFAGAGANVARRALELAALRAFGDVDPGRPTVDRLPLQLIAMPPMELPSSVGRSFWRSPVMLVALALALISAVVVVVLLVR